MNNDKEKEELVIELQELQKKYTSLRVLKSSIFGKHQGCPIAVMMAFFRFETSKEIVPTCFLGLIY